MKKRNEMNEMITDRNRNKAFCGAHSRCLAEKEPGPSRRDTCPGPTIRRLCEDDNDRTTTVDGEQIMTVNLVGIKTLINNNA
eukprot:2716060-Pyramimonas_sp.AAC.1